MTTPILHHYATSPFSEKVRLLFGLKGLNWSSVDIPNIMPKPDYLPLTGGYRRTPSMQIGADVYCDTQVILAELETRYPETATARGLDWAINLWADRLFFQTTVPVIFGELGDHVPADFIKDREALSGRPFDTNAMKSVAPTLAGAWRAQAGWIEDQLALAPWISGDKPGLADIAVYMNVWFLGGALPHLVERFTEGMPRIRDWSARVRAIGHGTRTDLTGQQALAIAKAAEPAAAPAHDAANPQGLTVGQPVTVMADDYGRDPVQGTLVAAAIDRTVIARRDPAVGTVHVHFPKTGYFVFPA